MQRAKPVTEKQTADSVFYELTRSICPECRRLIDAEIHLRGGRVIMRKRCPDHGWFEALVSPDVDDYLASLKYNKPGTIPLEFLTEVKKPVDAEIRSTVKLLTWDELFNLEEDLRQLMELIQDERGSRKRRTEP